jgi:hypothetical protein
VWDLLPIGEKPRLLKTSSFECARMPASWAFEADRTLREAIFQGFARDGFIRG